MQIQRSVPPNSFDNIVSNQMQVVVVPNSNYVGSVSLIFYVSSSPFFASYDKQQYTFFLRRHGPSSRRPPTSPRMRSRHSPTNCWPHSPTEFPTVPRPTSLLSSTGGDNSTNGGRHYHQFVQPERSLWVAHLHQRGNYPVYVSIQNYLGAATTVVSTASVPPSLSLTATGANNIVSWPAWATDYQLQSATRPRGCELAGG